MINEQLINYIQGQQSIGVAKEEIITKLTGQGWSNEDILEGFKQISNPQPDNNPAIQPNPITKLPGVGELLAQTWSIYSKNWVTFVGILFLPILAILGSLILGLFGFAFGSEQLSHLSSSSTSEFGAIAIASLIILVIFAFIFVQIWAQIALLVAVWNHESKISILDAYKKSRSKIDGYFWISLLTFFILLGSTIFFIIPGIIFGIWFYLGEFVLVDENIGGFPALQKSQAYVKGHWWGVFWRILVVLGLLAVVSNLPDLISLVAQHFNLVSNKDALRAFSTLTSLLSLATLPFLLVYSSLLYRSLKSLKSASVLPLPSKGSKAVVLIISFLGIFMLPIMLIGLVSMIALTTKLPHDANPSYSNDNQYDLPGSPSDTQTIPNSGINNAQRGPINNTKNTHQPPSSEPVDSSSKPAYNNSYTNFEYPAGYIPPAS